MSRIRDIKRQSRRDLHNEALVPALYIETPLAAPVACSVRVHTQSKALGDLVGGELTNNTYAERDEPQPRLVLDALEIPAPKRGAVVSVEVGEAYRIAIPHLRDGEFIPVSVSQLTAAEAAGLPVPVIT